MNQNQSFNQEIDALNVAKLLQKQLIGGVLSDHEVVFLKQWCALYDKDNTLLEAVQTNDQELLSKLLSDTGYVTESKFDTDESLKRVLARIAGKELGNEQKPLRSSSISKTIWKVASAVAAMLVVAAGFFYVTTLNKVSNAPDHSVVDLPPGGNKATLILADGRQLSLSESNEAIIVEGNRIRYDDGTTLVSSEISQSDASIENKSSIARIVTPIGGSYAIVLSDGSKVWLNAHSRLDYPVEFDENERVVEVVGEAYFEVAKQIGKDGKQIPFLVKTNEQTVRVLGTSFNISAYEEDSEITTTLIEGSVQLVNSTTGNEILLAPGEQSSFKNGKFDKKQVNVALSTAWKNGFFQFERDDIQTVMKQISRWYGVEVIYEGEPIDMRITGKAYRSSNASQVLEILRHLDIPFKIEENAIVVSGKGYAQRINRR